MMLLWWTRVPTRLLAPERALTLARPAYVGPGAGTDASGVAPTFRSRPR